MERTVSDSRTPECGTPTTMCFGRCVTKCLNPDLLAAEVRRLRVAEALLAEDGDCFDHAYNCCAEWCSSCQYGVAWRERRSAYFAAASPSAQPSDPPALQEPATRSAEAADEIQRLRQALTAILGYRVETFDHPESEWAKHTPETCEECARWAKMKHPIQHACDGWYRLFYSRQNRNSDDRARQHWALRDIARDALDAAPPPAQQADLEPATRSLRDENQRLREALRKLVAEVSDLQVDAVRDALGNSNAAVLKLRADQARALLASPPTASPSAESMEPSDERQRLRRLSEAATPGRWRIATDKDKPDWWGSAGPETVIVPDREWSEEDVEIPIGATNDDGLPTVDEVANAAFIAAAVNYVRTHVLADRSGDEAAGREA